MEVMPTFVYTVIGGVLIFVIGQICVKFIIEPLHECRKCIGEITFAIIYYANIYSNPCNSNKQFLESSEEHKQRVEEVSTKLRQFASEINAKSQMIPLYSILSFFKLVPKRSNIVEGAKRLIGLSNSVAVGYPKHNIKYQDEITSNLNIKDI